MAMQAGRRPVSRGVVGDHLNYLNMISSQYRGASGRYTRTPEYKSLMLRDPRTPSSAPQQQGTTVGAEYSPLTTAPPAVPGNQGTGGEGGGPPAGVDNNFGSTPSEAAARSIMQGTATKGLLGSFGLPTGLPTSLTDTKNLAQFANKGYQLAELAQLAKQYGLNVPSTVLQGFLASTMSPVNFAKAAINMGLTGAATKGLAEDLANFGYNAPAKSQALEGPGGVVDMAQDTRSAAQMSEAMSADRAMLGHVKGANPNAVLGSLPTLGALEAANKAKAKSTAYGFLKDLFFGPKQTQYELQESYGGPMGPGVADAQGQYSGYDPSKGAPGTQGSGNIGDPKGSGDYNMTDPDAGGGDGGTPNAGYDPSKGAPGAPGSGNKGDPKDTGPSGGDNDGGGGK